MYTAQCTAYTRCTLYKTYTAHHIHCTCTRCTLTTPQASAEQLLNKTTILDGLHLNGVDRITLQVIRHMLDTYVAGAEFKEYVALLLNDHI